MNNFEVRFTNLLQNIDEDMTENPFYIVILSLYNGIVNVYTI
jgi:hypothetical protein